MLTMPQQQPQPKRHTQHTRQKRFWRRLEHFVLAVELPCAFTLAASGAVLAFMNSRPAGAMILLEAAIIAVLLWVIVAGRRRC